jgi:2-keto-4-pentenoate hydratase
MTTDFDAVARQLLDEHAARIDYHPLDASTGVRDLASAYGVQRRFVDLMIPKAGAPVGYKIGLTSPRMQKMCGINEPLAGKVLASRVAHDGVTLHRDRYCRLGLEFEVGVRLGRDLPARSAPFAMDEVAKAVDGVCAAVEIVDDRHADYAKLEALSLIADNAWNAGIVLGPFATRWGDLAAAAGVVALNGHEVDRGFGRDALGHPFLSLTWLANHLAGERDGLKKGDVVLTGSLVPTRFPKEPGKYRYELSGIGAVALQVVD